MNERGQIGVFPPTTLPTVSGTGTATSTTEFSPFKTSEPHQAFADLLSRYVGLLGGGAGSFQDLINYQREQGLEQLRNTQAARGLSSRSGVGVAGAAQFLKGFEPQAAAMQADYIKSLLGDYGGAISQGRTFFSPTQTRATTTSQESKTDSGGAGGSQFQYIPSNPYSAGMSGGGGGGSAPGGGGGGFSSSAGFAGHPTGGTLEQFLTTGGPTTSTAGVGPSAVGAGGGGMASPSSLGIGGFGSSFRPRQGETLFGTAGGGFVTREQMLAAGGQPGMGYDSGVNYYAGNNPALDAFIKKQQGGNPYSGGF